MTLAKPRGGTRYCAGCGARLAHDNAGPLCSPCRQAHRNLHNEAPLLGSDFWATDQMRDALASKDMSVVVRAYRRHPAHGRSPLPQADVAYWLGISQGQLSRIEAGRNSVRDLDKLVNYARRLHIPSELLWFEVDDEPQRPRGNGLVRLPGGPPVSAATARTEPALAESLLIALDQYAIMDNLAGPYSVLGRNHSHASVVAADDRDSEEPVSRKAARTDDASRAQRGPSSQRCARQSRSASASTSV